MINGYGKFLYKDGEMYEGQCQQGMRDGEGYYAYLDGSNYRGEWKRGCK